MSVNVTQDLKEFLLDNGFEFAFQGTGKVRYTYGTSWTDTSIKGEVWPLMFIQNTVSAKWHCYVFGLLLGNMPTPHELMVMLLHMKARGI